DVALVFYSVLDDRVLGWTLTGDARTHFSSSISRRELTRTVDDVLRQVDAGASLAAFGEATARLDRELIEPAIRAAGSRGTIVFVPDGPLARVPFAAIPDALGRPLLMTRTVAVSSSITALVRSSSRIATQAPTDVLAIGDGHDPRGTGLPRL